METLNEDYGIVTTAFRPRKAQWSSVPLAPTRARGRGEGASIRLDLLGSVPMPLIQSLGVGS